MTASRTRCRWPALKCSHHTMFTWCKTDGARSHENQTTARAPRLFCAWCQQTRARALQEDCLKYDTGISILAVRLTKPRIPEVVRKNYEARPGGAGPGHRAQLARHGAERERPPRPQEMEAQKTQLMIAIERQRVVEKEEETERKRAVISAQRKAEVSAIAKQQEIAEQEAAQNVSAIKDAMHLAKERAVADANAYRLKVRQSDPAKLVCECVCVCVCVCVCARAPLS
jgi:hypothetical protein